MREWKIMRPKNRSRSFSYETISCAAVDVAAASTNCGSAESPKFPCRSLLSHRCRRPPDYLRPERKIESSLFVADSEWPTSPAHSPPGPQSTTMGAGAGGRLSLSRRARAAHACSGRYVKCSQRNEREEEKNERDNLDLERSEGGREPAQKGPFRSSCICMSL